MPSEAGMLDHLAEQRLRKLLSDTIPLLCKNAFGSDMKVCVEALIGVTFVGGISAKQTVMVSFKESINADGTTEMYLWSKPPVEDQSVTVCQSSHMPSVSMCENNSASTSSGGLRIAGTTNKFNIRHGNDVKDAWQNAVEVSAEYVAPKHRTHKMYSNHTATVLQSNSIKIESEDDDYAEIKSDCAADSGDGVGLYAMTAENSEYTSDYQESGSVMPVSPRPHRSKVRSLVSSIHRDFRKKRTTTRLLKKPGCVRPSGTLKHSFNAATSQKQWQNMPPLPDLPVLQTGHSKESYDSMMEGICQDIVSKSSVQQQYVCHICSMQLCNAHSLKAHVRGTHLSMNQYHCNICQQGFKWYMQLHRHRKRVHADVFALDCSGGAENFDEMENNASFEDDDDGSYV